MLETAEPKKRSRKPWRFFRNRRKRTKPAEPEAMATGESVQPQSVIPQDATKKEELPKGPVLCHLRTRVEVRRAMETVDVHILPIPSKSASEVIESLKPIVPNMEYQHLRRLARPGQLPASTVARLPPPSVPPEQVLYLLVCSTTKATAAEIEERVLRTSVFRPRTNGKHQFVPQLFVTTVPANVPTSQQAADEWSMKYWPTIYKRGNPWGPHPSMVDRTVAKMQSASEYIQIAREAAKAVADGGHGYGIGAAIVDPKTGEVVAAAGDARFCKVGSDWCNPLDHAVLRLVEMVARKRVQPGIEVCPDKPVRALTGVEERYMAIPPPKQPSESPSSGESSGGDGTGDSAAENLPKESNEPTQMAPETAINAAVNAPTPSGALINGTRDPSAVDSNDTEAAGAAFAVNGVIKQGAANDAESPSSNAGGDNSQPVETTRSFHSEGLDGDAITAAPTSDEIADIVYNNVTEGATGVNIEGKVIRTKFQNGSYLCHNMHVFVTHEPCVMCSMALLHSRVGLVVFEHNMPKTGALNAEIDDGLGYGLFWRPDFNWKFLCYQWKSDPTGANGLAGNISA